MSLAADLLLVAEGDWTIDQPAKLREAVEALCFRLDPFKADIGRAGTDRDIGRIRSELLNIDDLRRAVATFGKYVRKWVRIDPAP